MDPFGSQGSPMILQLNTPTFTADSLKAYIGSAGGLICFSFALEGGKKSVSNPICPLSLFVQLFLISHTEGIFNSGYSVSHLFSFSRLLPTEL